MSSHSAPVTLAMHLALLSCISFGGFPSVLADIHNFVTANGWVTDQEFANFFLNRREGVHSPFFPSHSFQGGTEFRRLSICFKLAFHEFDCFEKPLRLQKAVSSADGLGYSGSKLF